MKTRERRQIADQLANHTPDSDPLLIVGTSSFIGEGFDCPALDTLFLAAPITFKNRLVQYIGRVTRPYPSKTTATVHAGHPPTVTPPRADPKTVATQRYSRHKAAGTAAARRARTRTGPKNSAGLYK
jgi:superfamily II DNA or RNA helicase